MKKSKKGLYTVILILFALFAGGYFLFTSQAFERQKPQILISDTIYWNLKSPLKFTIEDNSGIKSYRVVMDDGQNKETVDTQELPNPKKSIAITVKPSATLSFPKKEATLEIVVVDKSFWNYFLGNKAQKRVHLIIDTKRPELFVVNNSYAITKGGSALVVFRCQDDHLQTFYIKTNFGKRYGAQPFYKDGYYIALIAWPITQQRFRADIVAIDRAHNKSIAHIPLYLRSKRYKKSKITLKDSFLEGKVSDLAANYPETADMTPLQKFKFVNETLRKRNEDLIHKITSIVPKSVVKRFSIKPFHPLKNGAAVASFGDHRYYYYKGKLISESYHLGIDLASIKHAYIRSSNDGEVKFSDFNGIYGNMPIISHGLGLYTLYGHCSSVLVQKGQNVMRGQRIARTGNTGLALGDHLHFGVLVQGVEVRPAEWMDRHWIKVNITDVIKDAKKLIDSR